MHRAGCKTHTRAFAMRTFSNDIAIANCWNHQTMKSLFVIGLSFVFALLPLQQGELDGEDTVANFKAAFLFQFAVANNWPPATDNRGFVIGIVGGESVYNELVDKYANKPVGSQVLEVIMLDDFSKVSECEMIYISKAFTKNNGETATRKWIKASENLPVLVVSDAQNGLDWGAAINFKVLDSRIRYEINTAQAELHQITIGSKILSWAVQD